MSPRGGRRPGAGAKPGNDHALKHGLYSKFPDRREKGRARIRRALNEQGETIMASRDNQSPARGNIVPLSRSSIPTTPPSPDHSKLPPAVFDDLILRLEAYNFRDHADFVRVHWRHVDAIGSALDYLDDDPPGVTWPPGLLRHDVHMGIGVPKVASDGRAYLECPDCRWRRYVRLEDEIRKESAQ